MPLRWLLYKLTIQRRPTIYRAAGGNGLVSIKHSTLLFQEETKQGGSWWGRPTPTPNHKGMRAYAGDQCSA